MASAPNSRHLARIRIFEPPPAELGALIARPGETGEYTLADNGPLEFGKQ